MWFEILYLMSHETKTKMETTCLSTPVFTKKWEKQPKRK